MSLPEGLDHKKAQFQRSGRIVPSSDELFKETSWDAVLIGQGHRPRGYDPLIDTFGSAANLAHLRRAREDIRALAGEMREHQAFFC